MSVRGEPASINTCVSGRFRRILAAGVTGEMRRARVGRVSSGAGSAACFSSIPHDYALRRLTEQVLQRLLSPVTTLRRLRS